MNRFLLPAILVISIMSISLAKPVFAPVPVVQNVVPHDVGGSTYLDITVLHSIEIPSHYVNTIEVVLGSNTTDLTTGVQTLAPDGTFTVSYDLGPISGTPTITVKAHCIIDGPSITNWTGQVPEFTIPILMLILTFIASIAALALRKILPKPHK